MTAAAMIGGGRITANLPSRDFDRTEAFYGRLGFQVAFRNATWMILERDGQQVEFFPHPDLVPTESWFSACLRVADLDRLHADWVALELPGDPAAIPRLTPAFEPDGAPRMFALIDPDGLLWRVMEQESVT